MVVVGLIWDQYFCIYTRDTLNIVAVLEKGKKKRKKKKNSSSFWVCEKTESDWEKLEGRERVSGIGNLSR